MRGSRPAFIGNLTDGLEPLDDGGFPDMGGKGNRLGHRLGLTRRRFTWYPLGWEYCWCLCGARTWI